MNDVMSRIAAIRSRFVPTAAPVASGTAATAGATGDDFSAVLAGARTAGADDDNGVLDRGLTPGSGTGAGGIASTSLATLARSIAATGTGTSTGTASATKSLAALATRAYATTTPVPAAYDHYRDLIGTVATEEGVPASLLGALVWSESGFDPDAVSPAGARGLAQLMPGTADGLGVDIDDPADNLRGGARYLRNMLDRFGSVDLALAAYNAGPNAVTRAGGIPPYQETQTYVTRVMSRAAQLSGGTPS